jgi:NAD(P)-dependent dehydrogenase (short-subunit alcohol dehydrogenase family)
MHADAGNVTNASSDLRNKVIVITGATSGIGQVAAEQLAARGARIVQIARDRGRADEAMGRLAKITPTAQHTVHYADLLRVSEMKRVGAEIAAAESRIDVLLNNAGAMFGQRELTEDGMERTFALNHAAYFVITQQLRERLVASAPSRVVNTSSDAHQAGLLDFDDLQSEKAYQSSIGERLRYGGGAFRVYGTSKLLNILFTRELARRLAGTGVTTNCFHPGFVNTRFGDATGGLVSFSIGVAKKFALTPEQGAETMVYLATSPEVASVSGQYFHKCKPSTPTPAAQDDAAAKRLWEETAKLVG